MLKADRYLDLLHAAQHAFGAARQVAWDHMVKTAPIEEDQLFWLIDTALPMLEMNWAPILNGSGVSMRLSGVFCHKTPLAVYPDSKNASAPKIRRELGDLLMVHDHRGRNAHRQAILMQAKRMDAGQLKADNPEQARLYADWPLFELRGHGGDGSSYLNGDRNFKNSRDGARYLILDDERHPRGSWWCPCCDGRWHGFGSDHVNGWLVSDPRGKVGLPGSEDLATAFVNMLYDVYPSRGQRTKRYLAGDTLKLGIGEDFDVTVHELLTKTFTKDLLTTKRGRHSRKRGENTGFMGSSPFPSTPDSPLEFMSSKGVSGTEPPTSEHSGFGDGRPIAIVLVETVED